MPKMSQISKAHLMSTCSQSSSPRNDLFKNSDKNSKELRRRRRETIVELRKQTKDDDIEKRRHIYQDFSFENYSEDTEQENELSVEEIILVLKSSNSHEIPIKYIRETRRLISKELESSQSSRVSRIESNGVTQSASDLMNQLLARDVIMKLLNCLQTGESSITLFKEVVALIALLSSGGKEQSAILVKLGFVPLFISLLSYHNLEVVEHSVITLANISSASPEMRDIIMNTDFLTQLLPLISSETSVSPSKYVDVDDRTHLVRAMSWALFVMCEHKDMNSYKMANALLPYLARLLDYHDNSVKTNVLRALSITTECDSKLCENSRSAILKVVQMVSDVTSNVSLLASIIEYLSPQNNDVVLYAIRILANIVSWGESYAQIVIDANALNNFKHLITHQNADVQKEVAFTISNITAGNLAQIQAVIDAQIVPQIVELLYFGDYKTQLEVTHVILNISTIGSINQKSYLININDTIPNMNVFDAMATMLTADPKAIETALQVYNNLLVFAKKANLLTKAIKKCESCAALYHIDSLQYNSNSHLATIATHIIEQYFSTDITHQDISHEDLFVNTIIGSDSEKQMELNFSF